MNVLHALVAVLHLFEFVLSLYLVMLYLFIGILCLFVVILHLFLAVYISSWSILLLFAVVASSVNILYLCGLFTILDGHFQSLGSCLTDFPGFQQTLLLRLWSKGSRASAWEASLVIHRPLT